MLRDLYEQLETLLQRDLTVYRGKMPSKDELHRLKITGQLFITRNFLSTSEEKCVANAFSGDGTIDDDKVSVFISIQIDRREMQKKLTAFLRGLSQIKNESEVILPMGIVFRIDSYEEDNSHSKFSVTIKMIRGKDE
ncbi:unnamed protein product, partial [Rotaria sp. Silwood2]